MEHVCTQQQYAWTAVYAFYVCLGQLLNFPVLLPSLDLIQRRSKFLFFKSYPFFNFRFTAVLKKHVISHVRGLNSTYPLQLLLPLLLCRCTAGV